MFALIIAVFQFLFQILALLPLILIPIPDDFYSRGQYDYLIWQDDPTWVFSPFGDNNQPPPTPTTNLDDDSWAGLFTAEDVAWGSFDNDDQTVWNETESFWPAEQVRMNTPPPSTIRYCPFPECSGDRTKCYCRCEICYHWIFECTCRHHCPVCHTPLRAPYPTIRNCYCVRRCAATDRAIDQCRCIVHSEAARRCNSCYKRLYACECTTLDSDTVAFGQRERAQEWMLEFAEIVGDGIRSWVEEDRRRNAEHEALWARNSRVIYPYQEPSPRPSSPSTPPQ